MLVKLYKRTNKYFEDIFSKAKETKGIIIETGKDFTISIEEHQQGHPLRSQHIEITTGGCTYSMDMGSFIDKIIS